MTNRAPTEKELRDMTNEINARLFMHKFVTSHDERGMLKKIQSCRL
jgi:hypothetical protein